MSDYLSRLISTHRRSKVEIRPRRHSRFEPISQRVPLGLAVSEPVRSGQRVNHSDGEIAQETASPPTTLSDVSDQPTASKNVKVQPEKSSSPEQVPTQTASDTILPARSTIGDEKDSKRTPTPLTKKPAATTAIAHHDAQTDDVPKSTSRLLTQSRPSTIVPLATRQAPKEGNLESPPDSAMADLSAILPAEAVSANDGRTITPRLPSEAQPTSEQARRGPASPPPSIRVNIGRVEVRAKLPQTRPPTRPPAPPSRRQPALSLDAYLKQREEGG
jgi:hypothetical protein